jgi:hypothetical protein
MGRLAFRPRPILLPSLLAPLAAWGLLWGIRHGLTDSADLWRRAEEAALFLARSDPYADPDLSYPPSAAPVFAGLIAPFPTRFLPAAWVALNLVALAALATGLLRIWGRPWPGWLRAAFLFALAASKPVRAGIALGQFHLIPTALVVWSFPLLASGRDVMAGLLVGLALMKPTMALPILGIWLLRREWRALGVAIGAQAALTAATSAWLAIPPWTLTREWLANARLQEAAGTIDVPTILARIWPGLPISGTTISLIVLSIGMAGFYAVQRASSRNPGVTDLRRVGTAHRSSVGVIGSVGGAHPTKTADSVDLDAAGNLLSLGLYLAAIFAYHRHYDLVLLLPALAWLVERGRLQSGPAAWPIRMVAMAFAAMLILPSNPAPLRRFEAVYELAFLATSYVVLGLMIAMCLKPPQRQSRDGVGTSDPPRVESNRSLCGA